MFNGDMCSVAPGSVVHGCCHVLAPFTMEDGRRRGAHAQAFLFGLACMAMQNGMHSRPLHLDLAGGIARGEQGQASLPPGAALATPSILKAPPLALHLGCLAPSYTFLYICSCVVIRKPFAVEGK
jgi:hypothetical protein